MALEKGFVDVDQSAGIRAAEAGGQEAASATHEMPSTSSDKIDSTPKDT